MAKENVLAGPPSASGAVNGPPAGPRSGAVLPPAFSGCPPARSSPCGSPSSRRRSSSVRRRSLLLTPPGLRFARGRRRDHDAPGRPAGRGDRPAQRDRRARCRARGGGLAGEVGRGDSARAARRRRAGQGAVTLHTIAPGPVPWVGESSGNTTCGAPVPGQPLEDRRLAPLAAAPAVVPSAAAAIAGSASRTSAQQERKCARGRHKAAPAGSGWGGPRCRSESAWAVRCRTRPRMSTTCGAGPVAVAPIFRVLGPSRHRSCTCGPTP